MERGSENENVGVSEIERRREGWKPDTVRSVPDSKEKSTTEQAIMCGKKSYGGE